MATGQDALLRDEALLAELEQLKGKIVGWATERDLWHDAGFKIPFLHRNEAPRECDALLMYFDGPLHQVFNAAHEECERLEEEFRALLDGAGFYCELEDGVTMSLYPKDEAVQADYLKLHRWQWVQHLSERRLFDLHAEIFEHFSQRPEDLNELHWRKYEQFLDSVFRNQGFRTELGPGSDDGGVDIRLYQSESIPEIVTLVQAKRHKKPIGREPVAALAAVAQMEYAPQALFVTTSRYQPAARKFALNTESRLDLPTVQLADLSRTQEWCASIAKQLADYFQSGEQAPPPPIISSRPRTELTGKIVVASRWSNTFAIIEADYPHEVILRPIGHHDVSGDGLLGTQMPDLNAPAGGWMAPRILAFKRESSFGGPTFWGGQKLYGLWDGTPQHFDLWD